MRRRLVDLLTPSGGSRRRRPRGRTGGGGRSRVRWLPAGPAVAVALAVALFATACAGREASVESSPGAEGREPSAAARSPGAGEAGEGREGAPESEARADRPGAADERGGSVPATDPGAGTPSRRASERLVATGAELLGAGRAEEAARTLERAIRVDPSHGEAYHQLARVRARQGREAEAVGLLDRAVELLRPYPERRAAAEGLRRRLSGG